MGNEQGFEFTLDNGFKPHRFKSNPMEKRFAEKWRLKNIFGVDVMNYILSIHDRKYDEPTQEEIRTANGVIQWLGSPVGLSFIRDVLNVPEPCHNCVVQACCSKRSECEKYQNYSWSKKVKGKK
jgi:hypothetical protein